MINNKRQKEILNILINTNKVLTGKELCSAVGVSSRTIRTDIKEINYLLKDNGGTITSEKGKGYELKIFEKEKFEVFINLDEDKELEINLTTEDRVEYILIRLLEIEITGKEAITQTELSDELFVSLSSLKNDIKVLKEELYKNKLKLQKIGNKGIGIAGSEEKIRSIINQTLFKPNYTFINIFNKSFYNIYGEECIGNIRKIVNTVIGKYNLRFSDIAYNSLISHLGTILIRHGLNKNITYSEEALNKFKGEDEYKIAKEIAKETNEAFKLKLPDGEVSYLVKYILAGNLINPKEEVGNYVGDILNKILYEIKEKVNLDLSEDKILKSFLGNHLKAAINRAKYNVKMSNPLLSTIKTKCPFTFELGVLANEVIYKELGLQLLESDIGYLALHFEASVQRLKNQAVVKVKEVIVVCSTGMGTSLFLKVNLESKFKNKLKIVDTLSCYEFTEELLEKVDMVITTVPLKCKSKKIIYVKNLLDSNEINEIKELLEEDTVILDDLIKNFKEELFFRDLDGCNNFDIINDLTDRLVNMEYLSKESKHEIIKREKTASTEIGNLVAIPHTIHNDINESFIAVATFKKPVPWENDKVQIIFLIGMASKDREMFKECLERLYRGIISLEFVIRLINAKDYKTFIDVIGEL